MTQGVKEDVEDLKRKLRQKQEQEFQLHPFILHTLDQFGHRYLATEQCPQVTPERLGDNIYGAKAIEHSLSQALASITDPRTRQKIRSLPASPGQHLLYGLYVEIDSPTPRQPQGQARVMALIQLAPTEKMLAQKSESLKFTHPLELRNLLPQSLERSCEIFV